METIIITHREDNITYAFKVRNPNQLSAAEVRRICKKMGVNALFINGKYYDLKNFL